MKRSFFYFLLLGVLTFAGINESHSQLQNLSYDHAEIYYLNTDFPLKKKPDALLFKDGQYAESKKGNGHEVSKQFMKEFNEVISKGIDELYTGLSKTFLPQVGLLFFDSLHQPIASISLCFSCEGIRWWPQNIIDAKKVKRMNIKKAEKQIRQLKELFLDEILIFDRPKDFHNYIDSSIVFKNHSEVHLKPSDLKRLIPHEVLVQTVENWNQCKSPMKHDTIEKITHGGQSFYFKELKTSTLQSQFLFSDVDSSSYLTKAIITDPCIEISNGILIGMSQDQLINKLSIPDTLLQDLHPKLITLEENSYEISFHFKHHTLIKIVLTK